MMRRLDRRNAARPQARLDLVHEAPAVSLVLGEGPGSERITGTKLLIGSDTECDVRLEDPEAPSLHTIVHSDRDGVWLDVVISDPPVYVNGEEADWSPLHDGDVIEIGLLEMTVRLVAPQLAAHPAWEVEDDAVRTEGGRRLRTAAASDRKKLGATALLRAAFERHSASNEYDEEDGPSTIVPIRGFLRGANPTLPRVEVDSCESTDERMNRLVIGLEELAARSELLARELDTRVPGRLRAASRVLSEAEKSLEILARLMDEAQANGPVLHAPAEDARAAA